MTYSRIFCPHVASARGIFYLINEIFPEASNPHLTAVKLNSNVPLFNCVKQYLIFQLEECFVCDQYTVYGLFEFWKLPRYYSVREIW